VVLNTFVMHIPEEEEKKKRKALLKKKEVVRCGEEKGLGVAGEGEGGKCP